MKAAACKDRRHVHTTMSTITALTITHVHMHRPTGIYCCSVRFADLGIVHRHRVPPRSFRLSLSTFSLERVFVRFKLLHSRYTHAHAEAYNQVLLVLLDLYAKCFY
jgi:hypothetical protein